MKWEGEASGAVQIPDGQKNKAVGEVLCDKAEVWRLHRESMKIKYLTSPC